MTNEARDRVLDALFLLEDYIETGFRRPVAPRRAAVIEAAGRGAEEIEGVEPPGYDRPGTTTPAVDAGRRGGVSSEAVSSASGGRPPGPPSDSRTVDTRTVHERQAELAALEERVRECTKCSLHQGRTNAVPGIGVLDPLVMVIGEGPGADEDRTGEPFVGAAGKYLDKWLEAIDMSRSTNAYIANIVKCRPPGNRDPLTEEAEACIPYLHEQILLIRPKTILTVGRIATGYLLGSSAGIGTLRGTTYDYRGIPLVATYHPSGVLRNPDYRRPVWEDLKLLRSVVDSYG